jgi:hypothetical protein
MSLRTILKKNAFPAILGALATLTVWNGYVAYDGLKLTKDEKLWLEMHEVCENIENEFGIGCKTTPRASLAETESKRVAASYFHGSNRIEFYRDNLEDIADDIKDHEVTHAILFQTYEELTGKKFSYANYLGVGQDPSAKEILSENGKLTDEIKDLGWKNGVYNDFVLERKLWRLQNENEKLLTQEFVTRMISEGIATYVQHNGDYAGTYEDSLKEFEETFGDLPDHIYDLNTLNIWDLRYSMGAAAVKETMDLGTKEAIEYFATHPPIGVKTFADVQEYFDTAKSEVLSEVEFWGGED